MLEFLFIYKSPFEVLLRPQLTLTNSDFVGNMASVDTGRLIISIFRSLMAAGVALNVIGMWLVHQFFGDFLVFFRTQKVIPRGLPVACGNREPIRTRKR
jgi:hypothetical protein